MGNLILFQNNTQMGGVATVPVDCANFTTAEAIDGTFEDYMNNGVLVEAEGMMAYGWTGAGLWVYGQNLWSYVGKMDAMLTCGLSANVDGSKYATEEFVKGQWATTMTALTDNVFAWTDWLVHPAFYGLYFTPFLFVFTTPLWFANV